jgi:hypothetical protein
MQKIERRKVLAFGKKNFFPELFPELFTEFPEFSKKNFISWIHFQESRLFQSVDF